MKKLLINLCLAVTAILDRIALIRVNPDAFGATCNGTVKFSALVTDIKGKVGGSVFQGSKVGPTIKNKPNGNYVKRIPWTFGKNYTENNPQGGYSKLKVVFGGRVQADGTVNPFTFDSTPQQIIRQLTKQWSTLTPDERANWSSAAVNFPFTNRYGQAYTGSGFQVFVSINSKLVPLGVPLQTFPPSPSDGILATWVWDTINIDLNSSTEKYLQLQIPDGVCTGAVIIVSSAPQQSAGKLKVVFGGKNAIIVGEGLDQTIEMLPLYQILFGNASLGNVVQFEVNVVNLSNGHVVFKQNFSQQIQPITNDNLFTTSPAGQIILPDTADLNNKLIWAIGSQIVQIGNIAVDAESNFINTLLKVLRKPTNAPITVIFAGGDINQFNYHIGDLNTTLISGATIATGKYGMVPITPIFIQFTPDSAGLKQMYIIFQCSDFASDIIWTVQGTGV